MKTVRNIVKIDEEKCNGCGECITACAEGALALIDGKAKLISEKYCDGLGNCLNCPQGAIIIEQREAEAYDEAAVEDHLHTTEPLACGCPSTQVTEFDRPPAAAAEQETAPGRPSHLGHWPVQLTLVPPTAPFLKDADVVLTADCVPFAYAGFHEDFLGSNKVALVACPKLDDFTAHQEKLALILKHGGIRSLTAVHMEVPCCSGLVHMAKQAMLASGTIVPFRDITIGIKGDRLAD